MELQRIPSASWSLEEGWQEELSPPVYVVDGYLRKDGKERYVRAGYALALVENMDVDCTAFGSYGLLTMDRDERGKFTLCWWLPLRVDVRQAPPEGQEPLLSALGLSEVVGG